MLFDIKNETDVALLRAAFNGKKIGLTSGSFDLFHHMHLVYLTRCRRMCDMLVVGVDSNDLINKRKGPKRPLVPEHQRAAVVSALSCVQAAFILGSVEDFAYAAQQLEPAYVFKNSEKIDGTDIIGGDNAEVIIIRDITQHSSTTEIIEEIMRMREQEGKDDKR
jgi:D-beta-D-heptose 7-phosphate kinase/D-beta-D-heptose 1-phosphate adenosyltransferase